MTREKIIQNYDDGIYEGETGKALFYIDLDDLIISIQEEDTYPDTDPRFRPGLDHNDLRWKN